MAIFSILFQQCSAPSCSKLSATPHSITTASALEANQCLTGNWKLRGVHLYLQVNSFFLHFCLTTFSLYTLIKFNCSLAMRTMHRSSCRIVRETIRCWYGSHWSHSCCWALGNKEKISKIFYFFKSHPLHPRQTALTHPSISHPKFFPLPLEGLLRLLRVRLDTPVILNPAYKH